MTTREMVCVRACVYMCFKITINRASAMAYNQRKPEKHSREEGKDSTSLSSVHL